VAGLRVASTGVVDYGDVCRAFARDITEAGSELRFGAEATAVRHRPDGLVIETTAGDFAARFLVNCAGLQSDRVAKLDGHPPPARIVPFRGEYYELVPERRHLVRGLVYPVPNPDFPFLGVHFTRMIDGSVHAGPNAVPALKREGYRKRDGSLRDTAGTLAYGGFWRLAAKHAGEGLKEVYRSLSKAAFVKTLQRLVPEVTAADVVPAGSGVRAQALLPSGVLVDDFLIVRGDRSVHVCNAPSPAATASIEIGRAVADHLPPDLGRS
jgi:(S)-2-hydroxyglutarate dehydrogenase